MTRTPATEEQWVCRTCRRPLDAYQRVDQDGTIIDFHWIHPAIDDTRGVNHEPDPVRLNDTGGELVTVCDFCTAPHPTWIYPCTSFTLGPYGSVGNWGACTTCHQLIQRNNWNRITYRALAQHPHALRAQIRQMIEPLHKAFRQHRTGPPYQA